jgi:hypothetical protein
MCGNWKWPVMVRCRPALFALSAFFAAFVPNAFAAPQMTLEIKASPGLPGLHHSALSRFVASSMAKAGLTDWRFEPAEGERVAADRVEWSFRLNPFAGGAVRTLAHTLSYDERFSERRPITIEARLYIRGEYQTLVESQATIRGGPDDPDLTAAVVSATRNLLGPSGAYRAIDMGQYRTGP